ncbi:hypothetical protein GTH32_18280 [Alteromonas sp. 345S023]|uniref:Uncharacterized protein n=1 Tax=Alteromonas profundi TaxID=2696062 RepID=A0A7X5RN21_9ALTE|nr:hypothetical protein [Alteromonas profundi]NDV93120.1 hypothetical protein [Alteromonas profundi]
MKKNLLIPLIPVALSACSEQHIGQTPLKGDPLVEVHTYVMERIARPECLMVNVATSDTAQKFLLNAMVPGGEGDLEVRIHSDRLNNGATDEDIIAFQNDNVLGVGVSPYEAECSELIKNGHIIYWNNPSLKQPSPNECGIKDASGEQYSREECAEKILFRKFNNFEEMQDDLPHLYESLVRNLSRAGVAINTMEQAPL